MTTAATLPARRITRSAGTTWATENAELQAYPFAQVEVAAALDVPPPPPALDALPGLAAFCLYCANCVSLAGLTANTWRLV
jgi:hypothetical protein